MTYQYILSLCAGCLDNSHSMQNFGIIT